MREMPATSASKYCMAARPFTRNCASSNDFYRKRGGKRLTCRIAPLRPTGTTDIARILLCAVPASLLCLLLSGCFVLPGKFVSHLDIRRDGSFTFNYTGELVFATREEGKRNWSDVMAYCSTDKDNGSLPCSENEIRKQRIHFEEGQVIKSAQAAQIAAVSGYNSYDRDANDEIARRMTGYQGWKEVVYVGDGVFDVYYQMSGNVDHDVVFPVLPQAQMVVPFITIRRSKNGNILEIDAPTLSTIVMRSLLYELTGAFDSDDFPLFERTEGTFVITTDADLTDTNGKTRKDSSGQAIEWHIDGALEKMPHTQLALDAPETTHGGK